MYKNNKAKGKKGNNKSLFQKVKIVIKGGLLACGVLYITSFSGYCIDTYTVKAVVTEKNIFTDQEGEMWMTYDHNYSIGDEVVLVMDTNGTKTRLDDRILSVEVLEK